MSADLDCSYVRGLLSWGAAGAFRLMGDYPPKVLTNDRARLVAETASDIMLASPGFHVDALDAALDNPAKTHFGISGFDLRKEVEAGGSFYPLQAYETFVARFRGHTLRKRLLTASGEIYDKSDHATPEEAEATGDWALARIASAIDIRGRQSALAMDDLLEEGRFERLLNPKPGDYMTTGFMELDEGLGGFRRGELAILAAPTSHGKTTFAWELSRGVASTGGQVLFASLEMRNNEILRLALAAGAGIDRLKMRRPKRLTDEEKVRLREAKRGLQLLPLFLTHEINSLEALWVDTKRRFHDPKAGLDFVVVDYLQLMGAAGKFFTRHDAVGHVAKGLKRIALDMDCVVLATSQISREIHRQKRKHLQLSDLRESGSIEEAADIVMLLWRPARFGQNEPQSVGKLNVAKNRNGPVTKMELNFEPRTGRWGSGPKMSEKKGAL